VLPLPGREEQNPPVNHHGVDLRAIRRKLELNRASIQRGRVVFPGLGVSKHPMTIVTTTATYVVGWAASGGVRPICPVGESPVPEGRILYLEMEQPMVFIGRGGIICVTQPVVFIARRVYHEISAPELPADELPLNHAWSGDFPRATETSLVARPNSWMASRQPSI